MNRRGRISGTEHAIDRMVRNVETGHFERSLSALTAAGALVTAAEIFFEHDRASFGNKMMWVPVALGPAGAVAGIAGVASRRMAKTALPMTSAAIVANGLQGTYLHARGIAQKPGGWSNARYNLEMGPPLLAPLLVTWWAGWGCAAILRRRSERPPRGPSWDWTPVRLRRAEPGPALDQVTTDLVRPGPGRRPRWPARACAGPVRLLLDQPSVPVLALIDARLAAGETDGWRYADMPEDGQAWRDTLAYLDGDAHERFVTSFAGASRAEQAELVQAVQDADRWHGMPAGHVWSLWTRYACTAFYSYPAAWAEIGFPGPAYPRGYTNAGMDGREPFEVRDARPGIDPVRKGD